MFGLGMGEVLIILVFALIFIGPKKLPELAKTIGKGLREFQRTKDEILSDIHRPAAESEKKAAEKTSEEAIDVEYQHHESPAFDDHHESHHHSPENAASTVKKDPEDKSS